jgi:hypothetical protein
MKTKERGQDRLHYIINAANLTKLLSMPKVSRIGNGKENLRHGYGYGKSDVELRIEHSA